MLPGPAVKKRLHKIDPELFEDIVYTGKEFKVVVLPVIETITPGHQVEVQFPYPGDLVGEHTLEIVFQVSLDIEF